MTTTKEYSSAVQREVSIDVDALLEAIQDRSSGDVKAFMDNETAPRVQVDGRGYKSWIDLADAFELDIHDFTVTEASR